MKTWILNCSRPRAHGLQDHISAYLARPSWGFWEVVTFLCSSYNTEDFFFFTGHSENIPVLNPESSRSCQQQQGNRHELKSRWLKVASLWSGREGKDFRAGSSCGLIIGSRCCTAECCLSRRMLWFQFEALGFITLGNGHLQSWLPVAGVGFHAARFRHFVHMCIDDWGNKYMCASAGWLETFLFSVLTLEKTCFWPSFCGSDRWEWSRESCFVQVSTQFHVWGKKRKKRKQLWLKMTTHVILPGLQCFLDPWGISVPH